MTLTTVALPILVFTCFLGFAFFINSLQYRQNKKTATALVNTIQHKASQTIKGIRADVYTSGTRSGQYNRFKRCDLYFTKESIIIIGYTIVFGKMVYANPIVLQQNDPRIKKVNPDSFGHEVYIDFTKTEKPFHNIEIHLKGLTDDERALFGMLA